MAPAHILKCRILTSSPVPHDINFSGALFAVNASFASRNRKKLNSPFAVQRDVFMPQKEACKHPPRRPCCSLG